jgi:hypothetical protein
MTAMADEATFVFMAGLCRTPVSLLDPKPATGIFCTSFQG